MFLYTVLMLLFTAFAFFYYDVRGEVLFFFGATVMSAIYALITGTRYGWGADYLLYKYRFEHVLSFDEPQIGFKLINSTIDQLNLNYVGAFVVYGFLFSICTLLFIRSYKGASQYMYLFWIPSSIIFTTGLIRQGVALSFIMLMILAINRGKYWLSLLPLAIAISIHASSFITAGIIYLCYFFFRNPFNWRYTIPIYLIFTFLIDSSIITKFSSELFGALRLGWIFDGYTENADQWFGDESVDLNYQQGFVQKFLTAVFHLSILYSGYYACKALNSRKVTYIYNVVVIGMITLRIFFLIEILRRIAQPLEMLNFIIIGLIFYYFGSKNRIYSSHSNYITLSLITIVVYSSLFITRFIFFSPTLKFFWNVV